MRIRTMLIATCAALMLMPRPVEARPRLAGVVVGIAAGAAIGLLAGRRAYAHRAPRRYAYRHSRPRRVAYARERSRGEERAQRGRAGRMAAARGAGGHVGWAGPVFWPYAYDDIFNYAFER